MPAVRNFGALEYSEQIRENAWQRGTKTLLLMLVKRISFVHSSGYFSDVIQLFYIQWDMFETPLINIF